MVTEALGPRLVLLAILAVASCGESSANHGRSPDASGGSAGTGSSADGGDARDSPPCAVVCERYEAQCGTEENCPIFCNVWRNAFSECTPEFDAFYTCSAADAAYRFDCAQDFGLQQGPCERENATLHYCDRAGGLDCKPESTFDESCTVGPNPRPPHFHFCRLDATPPAGCVPYQRTSPDYPFAYCCP